MQFVLNDVTRLDCGPIGPAAAAAVTRIMLDKEAIESARFLHFFYFLAFHEEGMSRID